MTTPTRPDREDYGRFVHWSDRDLALSTFIRTLNLEASMSALDDIVTQIKTEVSRIADAVTAQVADLQSKLATAETTAADEGADISENVDALTQVADQLRGIAATPTPPVDGGDTGGTGPGTGDGTGDVPPADGTTPGV